MKFRRLFLLLTALLIGSLSISACTEEEQKHVIFARPPWSGNHIVVQLSKILLEDELGYTSEIKESSVAATWTAIGTGEAHLWPGAWIPNQESLRDKYSDTTESLGMIYTDCVQGWMVPKGVAEEYNITEIPDLNDPEIAKLFDLDNDGIGDILGCDAAWKCAETIDEEIKAYGLDSLYVQKYGAEAMMMAAIEGRMKKDEPVLFYMYTPHPFFVQYPVGDSVVWLDDPKSFWPIAEVYKYGNSAWISNNPKAAELLRQVKLTTDDIGWSMAQVEEKGDNPEALEAMTKQWIEEHQTEVDSWLKAVN